MGRKNKWWNSLGNWGRRWGNRWEDEDDDGDYTDFRNSLLPTMSSFGSQIRASQGTVAGTSQIVAAADDDADDQDDEICFGTLRGNIVGIQYYRGTVSKKEMVALEREPENRYDINAIKVNNALGVQVGHIKRELARPLAFILDTGLARLEGIVPFGQSNVYSMPVDLLLWGKPDNTKATVNKLKSAGYYLTNVSQGPRYSGDGGQDQFAASSTPRRTFLTPAEVKDQLDELFQSIKEGDKTSVTEPAEAIQTKMYPHQKQALNWMKQCENSGRLPPFWQDKKGKFFNTVLNFTTDKRPESVKGGILADDMGLGKTLEMISLIVTNFRDNKPLATPISGLVRQTRQESKAAQKAQELPTSESITAHTDTPILLKCRPNKSNIITPKNSDPVLINGGCSSKVTLPTKEGASGLPPLPKLPQIACAANVITPKKETSNSTNIVTPTKGGAPCLPSQPKLAQIADPANIITPKKDSVNSSADVVTPKKEDKGLQPVSLEPNHSYADPEKGPYKLVKMGKAYILFSGETKVAISPEIHKNGVLELHDTIVTTEQGEAYEIMDRNGQITFEAIPTATVSSTIGPGGDMSNEQDTIVIEDAADSNLRECGKSSIPSFVVKDDPDINPRSCGKSNIIPAAVEDDPGIKEYGDRNDKDDPDFNPLECGIDSMPSPKAGARGRSRRNTKRPARYVFSDDEVEVTQEEPVIKKVKQVSKKQSKGKALAKGTTTKKGKKKEPVILEPELSMVNSTVGKVESEPHIEPEATSSNAACMETDAREQLHSNPVVSNNIVDLTDQGGVDLDLTLPELDMPTAGGGEDQFMAYDLPDIEPVDLESNKDADNQHKMVVPDYSKPGTSIVGPSTGRTPCTGPRGTLIVCPLSVISNWLEQFERHVHRQVHLNIYLYYGPGRTNDYNLLEAQDVVITTYSTIASEYKKSGAKPNRKSLKNVRWLRIVLDEGHVIKNPSAQQTAAILQLQAERRWVLTGTPIQNAMKDLWSLINFLRISPFTDRKWWRRIIERPLDRGDESALKRVQHLMGHIALRRMKTQKVGGEPLVKLPARNVFIEHVSLSEEERSVYTAMQNEGKIIVSKYFRQGTLLHHYGDVLAILMRLRQLCCHPLLVAKAAQTMKETMAELEKTGGKVTEDLREKLIGTLVEVLGSGTDEECAVCLDSLKTPVITHCAHVYCRPCIEAVIKNEQPQAKCPLCRGALAMDKLLEVPPEEMQGNKTPRDQVIGDTWKSSAKTDALMNALLRLRAEDRRTKSIVVSQFTSLLSLIEIPLRTNGFQFVRLDGTMPPRARTQAMEEFSDPSPGSPTIILLSLKAGGVGINLTAASRVFLLDPAWNPASEEQCFDRCHRLGQTKDVVITKFVVEDSVEERMLELQEKKRKLMAGVFGHKQTDEEKRQSRIQDIKTLLDL